MIPLATAQRAKLVYAVLEAAEGGVEVRLVLPDPLPIGLEVHAGERSALLRRLMNNAGGRADLRLDRCVFPVEALAAAAELAGALQRGLERIAAKPIGQKHVERILGISAAERLRWSKDGRLPRSGAAFIRPSRALVSLSTYAPATIEALLAAPEVIAGWRARDVSEQGRAPQPCSRELR